MYWFLFCMFAIFLIIHFIFSNSYIWLLALEFLFAKSLFFSLKASSYFFSSFFVISYSFWRLFLFSFFFFVYSSLDFLSSSFSFSKISTIYFLSNSDSNLCLIFSLTSSSFIAINNFCVFLCSTSCIY